MKHKAFSIILKVLKSTVIDGVDHLRGTEMLVSMDRAEALTAEMPDRFAPAGETEAVESEIAVENEGEA
jgi:hypothetical protein